MVEKNYTHPHTHTYTQREWENERERGRDRVLYYFTKRYPGKAVLTSRGAQREGGRENGVVLLMIPLVASGRLLPGLDW